jgi:hypothetical protein
MKRTFLLLALVIGPTGPAAAQRDDQAIGYDDIRRFVPRTCPLSDSLLGSLPRPRQRVHTYRREQYAVVMSNTPFAITGTRPMDGILLNAMLPNDTPRSPANYTFQIRMKDSVLRRGAETRLALIADDSLEMSIGPMIATETSYSRGDRIDQMLTIGLRPVEVRHLATATTVRGRLGTTEFTIPDRTLESFRSVILASLCTEGLHGGRPPQEMKSPR